MNTTKNEVLVIHYKALDEHLDKWDQEDLERTLWPLDSMRLNLNRNLHNVLVWMEKETWVIEIDHENEAVTIVWNKIQWDPQLIGPMNDKDRDTKLYHLFTQAREYAERIGMSDKFFEKLR